MASIQWRITSLVAYEPGSRGSNFKQLLPAPAHPDKTEQVRPLLGTLYVCVIFTPDLAPFQGGSLYWTVPGVETPG